MFRETLVALVCGVFSLASLFILFRGGDVGIALTTLALFGGGALFMGSLALRRRKERLGGPELEVPLGVVFPLRRGKFVFGGLWAMVMGALGIAFGARIDPAFPYLMGVVGVFGALLVVGMALGFRREMFVFLGADGLRLGLGRAGTVLVRWDNLLQVGLGEQASQPHVLITVRDKAKLLAAIDSPNPTQALKRLSKSLKSNRTWYAADLVIMPRQYGLSGPALVKAMLKAAPAAQAS